MPFKDRSRQTLEDAHGPPHEEESSHSSSAAHDESNWLISYADMMTLLCGFFIMLFSMAKLEESKYDSFKQAMAKQFGGEYVSASQEMARFATQVIQEMGVESTTTIKADAYGVSIVFESTVFFNTLSADVSPEGQKILDHLMDSIKQREESTNKQYRIVVEGHTDGRPILAGKFPSNWELSGARASSVVRMFLNHGFPPDHLTAIGYADTHPQVDAKTPEGEWNEELLAKNRRVVLRILEPSLDVIPLPEGTTPAASPENAAPPPPLVQDQPLPAQKT